MSRSEFFERFVLALSTAVAAAEVRTGRTLPANRLVQPQGLGLTGAKLSIDGTVDRLWLGEDRFFRIIDIAVTAVDDQAVEFFVRPSGHEPAPWAQTLDPDGAGPFKQLEAMVISDQRSGT